MPPPLPGLASCALGEHRARVPQVVCVYPVEEGNQPPVWGTPSPGLWGFQSNKQIRTSLSLGFLTCKMGGLPAL